MEMFIFAANSQRHYAYASMTYSTLADHSARLNLVNSTLEARISHSRFVAFSEDTDRFACFASRPTRAEPRKRQRDFVFSLFVVEHGGNAETR